MLTPGQIKKYVNGDTFCPYCDTDADNFEFGELIFGDTFLKQRVQCNSCGKSWIDKYALVGIIEDS
jgi:transposase-like protein